VVQFFVRALILNLRRAFIVKPWDFIMIRGKPDSRRSNRLKEPLLFAILNLPCSMPERER